MRPDSAAIIVEETKVRGYLLAPRRRNDKSKLLARAGYKTEDWEILADHIRKAAVGVEAVPRGANPFGELFETPLTLPGRGDTPLRVKAIWFRPRGTDRFRLVTLVPEKEASR